MEIEDEVTQMVFNIHKIEKISSEIYHNNLNQLNQESQNKQKELEESTLKFEELTKKRQEISLKY